MKRLNFPHIKLHKKTLEYIEQLRNEILNVDDRLLNMEHYFEPCGTTACWLGWHFINNNGHYVDDVNIFECSGVTMTRCVNDYLDERLLECFGIERYSDDFDLLRYSIYNFLFSTDHESDKYKCEKRASYVLKHKAVPIIKGCCSNELLEDIENKIYNQ